MDIFLGHIYMGLFLCILGSCLKVFVQNWVIFLGCYKFKRFFGVLEIPDIFRGEG